MFKRALLFTFSLIFSGCASTHQTRSIEPSGFLGDYKDLLVGQEGEPLLIYVNPAVDFSKYGRILLEPVSVWIKPGSDIAELSKEDLKVLINYFDSALRRELARTVEFSDSSNRDVMRIRVALTEAEGSNIITDTLSTIHPQGLAISSLQRLIFGRHGSVGLVSVELEGVDSITGERLWAVADSRSGNKSLDGLWSTWDDAKKAFDFWAKCAAKGLSDVRKNYKPKEKIN